MRKNKHISLSNSNSSKLLLYLSFSNLSSLQHQPDKHPFHRDKRSANCTTKTRSSLWERLKEAGRDAATVEKEEKVEGERREKRKRKPIVVAIKKEEKREREEFPSVAVDEQQPRLEGEGTVEMALGRGRRGWKRGYRGFILIPAGA